MPTNTEQTTFITLIAAVAANGVIGVGNALPWHLPEDLKHFKALTLGHPIIMGRKTWESLGRPLPGRANIVVTRSPDFSAPGCTVAHSLEQAFAACANAEKLFIIGGAEIYRQALPYARCLELTEIHADIGGDISFPVLDPADWREVAREQHHAEAGFDYDFVTYLHS